MKRDLRGRRFILTGASRGIGRSLAEQLAREGARLVLAARSADQLTALAEQLQANGADALAVPTDITSEAERQRLFEAALSHLGGLDGLINNAGVASWAHFADCNEAILRQIMEVNFFAPTELIRLAIPHLTWGRQPVIVNVASMCGRRGMPAWSEYSASKFALCGLTEALRGELARFDIDVLLILPGLTKSELSKNLLMNLGRMNINFDQAMPSERVAADILTAIRRNTAEKILGSDARRILWFNRFFPRLTDWLIARRVRKLYAANIM